MAGLRANNYEEALRDLASREAYWAENPGECWGLSTPWSGLNAITGGLTGVVVIGARTSHGKTAWCQQLTVHTADTFAAQTIDPDRPTGLAHFFSPEMTMQGIVERFATQSSRVPLQAIKGGVATQGQRTKWLEAAHNVQYLKPTLRVYAGMSISYEALRETLDDADEAGEPTRLVVIDYIQRLRRRDGSGNRRNDIDWMLNDLKDWANEHPDTVVLIASQLNRDIEKDKNQPGAEKKDRPPQLADMKETGGLEEVADQGLLLYRPPEPQEVEGAKVRPQPATLYVAKNRQGPVGTVPLLYYPPLISFSDNTRQSVRTDGGQ